MTDDDPTSVSRRTVLQSLAALGIGGDDLAQIGGGSSGDEIANLLAKLYTGTEAERPAAGVEGRYYHASDTKTLYVDDGSSWSRATLSINAGTETNPLSEAWIETFGDPGDGSTYDATDVLTGGGGALTQVATGTVTATGGASPADNSTLQGISMTETLDYFFTVYVDADPAFNADYAFNYDYFHTWDDTNSEIDITVTVNWNVDPGSGNDVTLRWEVLQP